MLWYMKKDRRSVKHLSYYIKTDKSFNDNNIIFIEYNKMFYITLCR